jgi:hypothetical protein
MARSLEIDTKGHRAHTRNRDKAKTGTLLNRSNYHLIPIDWFPTDGSIGTRSYVLGLRNSRVAKRHTKLPPVTRAATRVQALVCDSFALRHLGCDSSGIPLRRKRCGFEDGAAVVRGFVALGCPRLSGKTIGGGGPPNCLCYVRGLSWLPKAERHLSMKGCATCCGRRRRRTPRSMGTLDRTMKEMVCEWADLPTVQYVRPCSDGTVRWKPIDRDQIIVARPRQRPLIPGDC